jgi:hypothetical protein
MDFFQDAKTDIDLYTMKINLPLEIPDRMPKYAVDFRDKVSLIDHTDINIDIESFHKGTIKELRLKEAYNHIGMYGFVSWKWINPFVKWLGDRKCLEVMSGGGWLSHALRQKGVDVIATDDFSWHAQGLFTIPPMTTTKDMDAVEAATKYGDKIDILLMSWPYMDDTAYHTIKALHAVNPFAQVVYIGEGEGGCTASEEFFNHFQIIEDIAFYEDVSCNFERWWGIRDQLLLGRYSGKET